MTDPDLTAELAALEAREADLDAQIEPLVDARARVRADIAAVLDLMAEQAPTDAEIVALSRRSYLAETRLEQAARALHPCLYSFERFHPEEFWRPDIPAADMLVGPHLSLSRDRGRTAADAPALAEALVAFAERFCPEVPEGGEYPGMVKARILDDDCGETRSYRLWYEPSLDGMAVLVDAQWGSGRDLFAGPIVDVVAYAIAKAAEPSPDDSW